MTGAEPQADPALMHVAVLRAVMGWRRDPGRPPACPACGASKLAVSDRSAQPHAEWYHLACGACGLDRTLHIALGAAVPPVD